jgi:hypothetical protein
MVRRNPEWAAAHRILAEQGDAKSQFALGAMYYYGKGLPKDCLDFMRIFHSEFNSARPGRRPLHSLSIGVRPLFLFRTTPPPSIQSPVPEPCSFIGQERARDDMRP